MLRGLGWLLGDVDEYVEMATLGQSIIMSLMARSISRIREPTILVGVFPLRRLYVCQISVKGIESTELSNVGTANLVNATKSWTNGSTLVP